MNQIVAKVSSALIALLIFPGCVPSSGPVNAYSYTPKGPVEAKYQNSGPWAVSKITSAENCDREGNQCTIWYPSNLGSNPLEGSVNNFKHPVIAWANGTGQTAQSYSYLLSHFASWGFIVVAPEDRSTGGGDTIVDAAEYIISKGSSPGNIFDDKIDVTNIGAAGHSQGGSTVIALLANEASPFAAYLSIHPSPGFFARLCCSVSNKLLNESASTGGIFYLGGSEDPPAVTEGWYNSTPAGASRALGILTGSRHDDVMGNPGCQPGKNCAVGAYGYLGYPTAWFAWKLLGVEDAAQSFNSENSEFIRDSSGWSMNQTDLR